MGHDRGIGGATISVCQDLFYRKNHYFTPLKHGLGQNYTAKMNQREPQSVRSSLTVIGIGPTSG